MTDFEAEQQIQAQQGDEAMVALKRDVQRMVGASVRDNEDWEPVISDGYNYMYDNQNVHVPVREGWSRPQKNQINPQMMQELGFIVNTTPDLKVQAQNISDRGLPGTNTPNEEATKALSQNLKWQFRHGLDIPMHRVRCALRGRIAGSWVTHLFWNAKSRWDAELKQWSGAPETEPVRLESGEWLCDPDAEDWKKARWMGTRRERRVSAAMKQWPQYAELIREAAKLQQLEAEDADRGGIDWPMPAPDTKKTLVELDGSAVKGEGGSGVSLFDGEGRVSKLLLRGSVTETGISGDGVGEEETERPVVPEYVTITELFFIDETEETAKAEERIPDDEAFGEVEGVPGVLAKDAQTGLIVSLDTGEEVGESNWPKRTWDYDRPMFPNGRRLLMAGSVVLNEDEEEQVWDCPWWPYIVGINYPYAGTWRGANGIEMARMAQDTLNEVAAHKLEYLHHYSDPRTLIEENRLIGDGTLKKVAKFFTRRAGMILKFRKHTIAEQGYKREDPVPMSPALAEMEATAKADVQIATGMHEIAQGKADASITATQSIELATNSRIRVGMQNLFLKEYLVTLMERVADLCQRKMKVGEMVQIVGEDDLVGLMEWKQELQEARYTIDLEIGTMLPFDEERQQAKASALFDVIGPAYLPELLEAFDVDNPDEILARVPIYQVAQQLMEEQAAAEEAGEEGGAEAGLPVEAEGQQQQQEELIGDDEEPQEILSDEESEEK